MKKFYLRCLMLVASLTVASFAGAETCPDNAICSFPTCLEFIICPGLEPGSSFLIQPSFDPTTDCLRDCGVVVSDLPVDEEPDLDDEEEYTYYLGVSLDDSFLSMFLDYPYDCDSLGNCWYFSDDSDDDYSDDVPPTDTDGDHIYDNYDNCPFVANHDQRDTDKDGIGDACDTCRFVINNDRDDSGQYDSAQYDSDQDGVGDACDSCPNNYDPGQADNDYDGVGDICDNCPSISNLYQTDSDDNGIGDVCEAVDACICVVEGAFSLDNYNEFNDCMLAGARRGVVCTVFNAPSTFPEECVCVSRGYEPPPDEDGNPIPDTQLQDCIAEHAAVGQICTVEQGV